MSQAQTQTLAATLNPAAIAADIVANRATNETLKKAAGKPASRKTTDKSNASAKSAMSSLVAGVKKMGATMVIVGGTDADPTYQDAADAPSVTLKELTNTGSTLQSLAFNFLAGTVDKSVTQESLKDLPRALRNEKGAITTLLGHKAGDIRAAWAKEMETRKRKDMPSLRMLASLVKGKKAKATTGGWREDVRKILDGKQSQAMKLQMLRELIDDTK